MPERREIILNNDQISNGTVTNRLRLMPERREIIFLVLTPITWFPKIMISNGTKANTIDHQPDKNGSMAEEILQTTPLLWWMTDQSKKRWTAIGYRVVQLHRHISVLGEQWGHGCLSLHPLGLSLTTRAMREAGERKESSLADLLGGPSLPMRDRPRKREERKVWR